MTIREPKTTHSKKPELLKDEEKMFFSKSNASKSTAELVARKEVPRARSTSLRACFTVSLSGNDQCCAWFFLCVCCLEWFLLVLFCHCIYPPLTVVQEALIVYLRCCSCSFNCEKLVSCKNDVDK